MFILKTVRLTLRDFTWDDLPSYLAMTSDASYGRYYSDEDCSEEKGRFLVEHFIEQSRERPRRKYQLALCLNGTGKFIGTCGIRMEKDGLASLGFGFDPEFQGRGFAREAAAALLELAFATLGATRVYSETISENTGAVKLCTSLGMVRRDESENRFFKGCQWETARFELSRTDYDRDYDKNRGHRVAPSGSPVPQSSRHS